MKCALPQPAPASLQGLLHLPSLTWTLSQLPEEPLPRLPALSKTPARWASILTPHPKLLLA